MKTQRTMIRLAAGVCCTMSAEINDRKARIHSFSVCCLLLVVCSLGFVTIATAADMAITPFHVTNQSPLLLIYGFPHDTGADIISPGAYHIALNQDLSSNYTVSNNTHGQLTLDGETYRLALAARYGITPRWEAGIEIPYIIQSGGFLDSFIVDWHETFHLPQGGRDSAPHSRVNYSYRENGVQKLLVDQASSGIGDIALTTGFSLYDVRTVGRQDRLAIKGALKLPTGDSSNLSGSGSTDFMLQLCGSSTSYGSWGTLGWYGSVGGLVMTKSDVLREQHNPIVGIGSVGFGWGPASWISFKIQLNGSTPMYRNSSLGYLTESPLLLTFGGALMLPDEYQLDIGVGENVNPAVTPDVSFHLGLSKSF